MNNLKVYTCMSVIMLIALFMGCNEKNPIKEEVLAATFSMPQNVLQSCALTATQFNSWFVSDTVSENGAVNPANSVDLVHNNNCEFYQWAAQMFLWITSKQASGTTVMESPTFYTVSPPNANNTRELIPHVPGQIIRATSNISKDGLIESEEGQATDDVLMAKDSSLIYYITMVNDVYAQFLDGVASGVFSDRSFPTTQAELDKIIAYARTKGVILNDANTLTVELKTSWIDASNLKDSANYVLIDAIIPTYTKTSATTWTPLSEKKARLALLGVHFVGSTSGHPEMVWATFEHKKNAPNLGYTYLDSNHRVQSVPPDTGNDWTLNSNASDPSYNVSYMKYDKATNAIMANQGKVISPSNTVRTKPWGVATDVIPNQIDSSAAASNSEIISLNNSLQTLLVGNDLRKNYFIIGATWTPNGLAPTGISYTQAYKDSLNTVGVAIGTSQLANSTMETYAQNGALYQKYGSCFACHSSSNVINNKTVYFLNPDSISHVFLPLRKGIVWNKKLKTK